MDQDYQHVYYKRRRCPLQPNCPKGAELCWDLHIEEVEEDSDPQQFQFSELENQRWDAYLVSPPCLNSLPPQPGAPPRHPGAPPCHPGALPLNPRGLPFQPRGLPPQYPHNNLETIFPPAPFAHDDLCYQSPSYWSQLMHSRSLPRHLSAHYSDIPLQPSNSAPPRHFSAPLADISSQPRSFSPPRPSGPLNSLSLSPSPAANSLRPGYLSASPLSPAHLDRLPLGPPPLPDPIVLPHASPPHDTSLPTSLPSETFPFMTASSLLPFALDAYHWATLGEAKNQPRKKK